MAPRFGFGLTAQAHAGWRPIVCLGWLVGCEVSEDVDDDLDGAAAAVVDVDGAGAGAGVGSGGGQGEVGEVAWELKVSRATAHRLIECGLLGEVTMRGSRRTVQA